MESLFYGDREENAGMSDRWQSSPRTVECPPII